MNVVKNRASINQLNLLNWADCRKPPSPQTSAGQWLQRRYRVAPHLADLLAAQALLGGEQ